MCLISCVRDIWTTKGLWWCVHNWQLTCHKSCNGKYSFGFGQGWKKWKTLIAKLFVWKNTFDVLFEKIRDTFWFTQNIEIQWVYVSE